MLHNLIWFAVQIHFNKLVRNILHELSEKQEQHSDMKSKVCFHLLYVAEMDPYHLLWIIKFHSQKKVSCAETIDISAEHLAISKWCFWDKMQESFYWDRDSKELLLCVCKRDRKLVSCNFCLNTIGYFLFICERTKCVFGVWICESLFNLLLI